MLMNAELDATVGPILKVLADRAGVVITNADGDEPSVAMNMFRFVKSIGYRPAPAGQRQGLPLTITATRTLRRASLTRTGSGPSW